MAVFIIPVCAASFAVFLFGMLWYSPKLFGNVWMKLQYPGRTMEQINASFSTLTLPVTLLVQSLALALLCYLISWCALAHGSLQTVVTFALCCGGITALMEVPHTAFAQKPIGLYFIDQVYNISALVIGSVIMSLLM